MFNLIILLTLLCLGYLVGQFLEKRHFTSIINREKSFINLKTTNSNRPIGELGDIIETKLVCGSAVISVDYFKRFLASLRYIFGGNVTAYETLLERARREAILRLKETCRDATQVINLRIETSSIYKGNGKQVGSVEVLAYATAVYAVNDTTT
ncbi:hypothetical protein CW745_01325 [Psychromonas sp. psych-6C06]|uniref:YbjQ family protein n=1 Tax=Psychromonas sp. psych-6C06 TaxID=2058089 RepID=UPI000C34B17B|nr:heavy metal-binding domain-containing protein [Psychromonas sp. psych-6C06]PKF63521.1 hypothetical protein CW745_01325 [Psychromonas sp. psych-6C06]